MDAGRSAFDSLIADLQRDREHAALFERILAEHSEELSMEVVSAALRRGLISPAEAIRLVRDCDFSFRRTVRELSSLGRERGWRARDVVLEALGGQPH